MSASLCAIKNTGNPVDFERSAMRYLNAAKHLV
jgi:hypothetical protein